MGGTPNPLNEQHFVEGLSKKAKILTIFENLNIFSNNRFYFWKSQSFLDLYFWNIRGYGLGNPPPFGSKSRQIKGGGFLGVKIGGYPKWHHLGPGARRRCAKKIRFLAKFWLWIPNSQNSSIQHFLPRSGSDAIPKIKSRRPYIVNVHYIRKPLKESPVSGKFFRF